MKKLLLIAKREFIATVATRAFVFGILGTPILIGLMIFLMPRLMREDAPKVDGDICIIDATGEVTAGLRAFLLPEAIAKRQQANNRRLRDAMPTALKGAVESSPASKAAMEQALQKAMGEVPTIKVVPIESGTDVESVKSPLKVTPGEGSADRKRLAVIVVHADAVQRAAGKDAFGSYDLFVRGKLDDRVIDEIVEGMRDALIGARVKGSGLERQQIDAMTKVERVAPREVTASGENTSSRAMNMMMPMAFMGLLLMSTMMSGSYLLTTTVEEKSNRVVEVLLSAVSPMELMVGKILGQLVVGLLVLAIYLSLGLSALISFSMVGMLDPMLIVYLIIFYLIAYVTVGAMMAAIGSAVNEMREAQGLMMPIMLIIMVPWMLWLPISRDPNSMFATVLSFVPPVGSFVMMLRLATVTPPPWWQAVLGMLVGALGSYAALWFAAKVFRIGLLMYGKPPSLSVLIRWARQS
jgi:ABC-2 type transport system permease protein